MPLDSSSIPISSGSSSGPEEEFNPNSNPNEGMHASTPIFSNENQKCDSIRNDDGSISMNSNSSKKQESSTLSSSSSSTGSSSSISSSSF